MSPAGEERRERNVVGPRKAMLAFFEKHGGGEVAVKAYAGPPTFCGVRARPDDSPRACLPASTK